MGHYTRVHGLELFLGGKSHGDLGLLELSEVLRGARAGGGNTLGSRRCQRSEVQFRANPPSSLRGCTGYRAGRAVGRRAWVGKAAPESASGGIPRGAGPPSRPALARAAQVLPTFSLPRAGLRSRSSRRPLSGPSGHRLRLSLFCRRGTCSRSCTGTGAHSRAGSRSSRRHCCPFPSSRENSICLASRRLGLHS